MIPAPMFFAGLAILTFVYCLSRALGDFRARRRLWGSLGLFLALAVPATILVASEALTWWLARQRMSVGGMVAIGILAVLVVLILRGIRGHGHDDKSSADSARGPNDVTGGGD